MTVVQPEPNPYQSPMAAEQRIAENIVDTLETDSRHDVRALVLEFRRQVRGLVVAEFFLGFIGVIFFFVVGYSSRPFEGRQQDRLYLTGLLGASGVVWLTLGSFTAAKRMGAVRLLLAFSYIGLVVELFQCGLLGALISAVIIWQSHRVLRLAARMRAVGLPLTARPRDVA